MAFSHPFKCFLEFHTANVCTPVPKDSRSLSVVLDVLDEHQNFALIDKTSVKTPPGWTSLRQIELLDLPDTWMRPHTQCGTCRASSFLEEGCGCVRHTATVVLNHVVIGRNYFPPRNMRSLMCMRKYHRIQHPHGVFIKTIHCCYANISKS